VGYKGFERYNGQFVLNHLRRNKPESVQRQIADILVSVEGANDLIEASENGTNAYVVVSYSEWPSLDQVGEEN